MFHGLGLGLGFARARSGGGPAPDPDAATPDPTNVAANGHPSGPFWQDFAKTTPATAGQTWRVWQARDGSGDLLYVSGTLPTVDAGGGAFVPAGTRLSSSAAVLGDEWTFYVWSDAPSTPTPNFMVGSIAAGGPTVAPNHNGDGTAFGAAATTYGWIADDGTEKLRGYSVLGDGNAIAFVGGSQSQIVVGTSDASGGVHFNAEALYTVDHVIRYWSLREGADSQALQNAHRRHVYRALHPIDPEAPVLRVAFVLHTEGKQAFEVGSVHHNWCVLTKARMPFAVWSVAWNPTFVTQGLMTVPQAQASLGALRELGRDVTCLHEHWLQSYCLAAGTTYNDHPTVSGALVPDGGTPPGYLVLATAHDLAAHRLLVAYGVDAVTEQAGEPPVAHVAGNYLTSDALCQALAENGITHELSAIGSELTTTYAPYEQAELDARWPTVEPDTQPYDVSTPGGPLRQLAIAGMTGQGHDIADRIIAQADDGKSWVVHCHNNELGDLQEWSDVYQEIFDHCAANGITFQSVGVNEL